MKCKILMESGFECALMGLGLSHAVSSGLELNEFVSSDKFEQMKNVSVRLSSKSPDHCKFLRQICVWLDITAPRYWWPEMDQYKVSTVTQSESTMHTIHKKVFEIDNFEVNDKAEHVMQSQIDALNTARRHYKTYVDFENKEAAKKQWKAIIQLLPQSYLQRRILTCNYETLRNILIQRTGHRLSEWAVFIDAIKTQCQHPEFLP